jgi:hypothetical protein
MPCSRIKLPDGTVAIVRHAKQRFPKCKFCPDQFSAADATLLCDFEIGRTLGGEPITCDAKFCEGCGRSVGPDKDFCPKHARIP